jgi:stearoyl-CoA desaturase (Delta-9 desaturase)
LNLRVEPLMVDLWFDSLIQSSCLYSNVFHPQHCFPWDYRTSETPYYWFNVSTFFIDVCAFLSKNSFDFLSNIVYNLNPLGLATDLKTVPADVVRQRVLRTGDGSHKYSKIAADDAESRLDNNNANERDIEHFWGWGDKEMTAEDLKNVEILHKELD